MSAFSQFLTARLSNVTSRTPGLNYHVCQLSVLCGKRNILDTTLHPSNTPLSIHKYPSNTPQYHTLSHSCFIPHTSFHTLSHSSTTRPTLQYTPLLPISTPVRRFSVDVDEATYEHISEETLESLSDALELLIETDLAPQDSDIIYNTGVLTLHLGDAGTYVINKQTPNKQIWLSSPITGPKRFDLIDSTWIYKHTGESLHGLISQELSHIFKTNVDLSHCAYTN